MEWSLLLAIVGVAALLQLVFFWYYLRAGQRSGQFGRPMTGEQRPATQAGNEVDSRSTGAPRDEAPVVTCEQCGFDNQWDKVFTYCGNCLSKLG
ncbi:MAG: hypothetical protein ACLFMX_01685 [Halobacteriales archaeon]